MEGAAAGRDADNHGGLLGCRPGLSRRVRAGEDRREICPYGEGGWGLAGKLLMKPHRVGILGLWVIGVAVAILLSCSIEEAQPIPTNAPAPVSTLTARQQEAIDHLKGRKSLATPIPTPTVVLTVTFIPTRTPARRPPPTLTAQQQEAIDYATGRSI